MRTLVKIFLLLFVNLLSMQHLLAQELTFGMFTDVHYADIPERGTRIYRQSLDKVNQCIDTMNRRKAGFLIELGDFKDMPVPPDKKATLSYLQTIETAFSRFTGERYHVLGNHDVDCISKEDFFTIARNSGTNERNSRYSFEKGGYHFIVLDACFDSLGISYNNGKFDWRDANVPPGEMAWLESDLASTKLPVILFVHQLLYGSSDATVRNAPAVRAILEKSRQVLCVFQGHEHSGGYEKINGIHYYTLKGMIEGHFPGSGSFAIVTLSPGKIAVRGYGNAISMTLDCPGR